MTQVTPTQELVSKDLHGCEWKFKHIFRGNTFVQLKFALGTMAMLVVQFLVEV